MGYKWPDNWTEVPRLQKVERNICTFMDGSAADVDAIILCTGYKHHFPFLPDYGGMIDDDTVFRLGPNNFRWIGGNDTSGLWLREQAVQCGISSQKYHHMPLFVLVVWVSIASNEQVTSGECLRRHERGGCIP
jgi:hypothetical protein